MSHQHYLSEIQACVRCAQECDHFAHEFAGNFGSIVRLCHDTAELCWTTAKFLSESSPLFPDICQLCAKACTLCADECEKSPDLQLAHCAEVCRECAEHCERLSTEHPPSAAVVQGSGVSTSPSPTV